MSESTPDRLSFHGILFDEPDAIAGAVREQPTCFGDLNLDQVVASITAGREEYDLTPFFYTPLGSVEAVAYRHEVLRDLQDEPVCECVDEFAQRMRAMRADLSLAGELRYRLATLQRASSRTSSGKRTQR